MFSETTVKEMDVKNSYVLWSLEMTWSCGQFKVTKWYLDVRNFH